MVSDLFSRHAAGYLKALKSAHLRWNAIPGRLTLHVVLDKTIPPAWLDRVRCTLVHDAGNPIGHFIPSWQDIQLIESVAVLEPEDKTNLMDFVGPDPFWVPVTWIALIDGGLIVLHRNPTTQAIPTLKPPNVEMLNWPPPTVG